MPLRTFLTAAAPRIDASVADGRERAIAVSRYLDGHLTGEPEIRAQLGKVVAILSDPAARGAAAREARSIMADVKTRWISAEAPPLLDEIDDRLSDIKTSLAAVDQPGVAEIEDAAGRIDKLASQTRGLEGIETRLTPLAIGAAVMFAIGLFLFFRPLVFHDIQPRPSSLFVLICLGALPALGAYYTVKIKPRSRSDAQIDEINRTYFLPNGGIYFPSGPEGPRVIPVAWTPPEKPLPLDKAPRDPRKDQDERDKSWW